METCCTAYQRLIILRHWYFITLCLVQGPEVLLFCLLRNLSLMSRSMATIKTQCEVHASAMHW